MEIRQLQDILQQKGVAGAGGAGFPTYMKLTDKAEVILLNCAECEPLLTLHQQLLQCHAAQILKAFDLIARTVGAKDAVIGVKRSYTGTIKALESQIGLFPGMRLHLLEEAYPMGDEVVLIYEATGRVVRPGGLPIEQGVAVFNVETVYNVYRAVSEDAPVTDKYLTICGEVANPLTVRVPIGCSVREAVDMAGGAVVSRPVFFIGGPMMGRIGSADEPVTKTTNAVLVLPEDHPVPAKKRRSSSIDLKRAASICCQCSTCTDLCPRHALGHPIDPARFMRAASNQDFRDLEPYINAAFCSSCGVCEMYACPQSLAPRSLLADMKLGLKKAQVKPPGDVKPGPVLLSRQFRKVPEDRLTARLGLTKYDVPAPLREDLAETSRVKILLGQHIGAPSKAVVHVGDQVRKGSIVGEAGQGLSIAVHASIDGVVTEVTPKHVMIIRQQ